MPETGRHISGLMVTALDSGLTGLDLSPTSWGHCIVFKGSTLDFHSASLYAGV